MHESEFMHKTREVLGMARQALEGILQDDDDAILSQSTIMDGGEMQEPNILEMARDKVARFQKEAREALAKKEKLERQVRETRSADSGVFYLPSLTTSAVDFLRPRRAVYESESLTDDVRAYLLLHAPDKLPVQVAPELSLEQRARLANADYCDACSRLAVARHELSVLEKKVNNLRELLRCV
jgi:hypothetical protein